MYLCITILLKIEYKNSISPKLCSTFVIVIIFFSLVFVFCLDFHLHSLYLLFKLHSNFKV